MQDAHAHSAVVGAEGHLIDSNILNAIFDKVIERGGAFEVLNFAIGRTNDEFSRISLKVSAPSAAGLRRLVEDLMQIGCSPAREDDALLRPTDRDGSVPDDFYSTTNLRTHVRVRGEWVEVERQRMDAVVVIEENRASCRKLREIKSGDRVVCGLAGIRVTPEFRERDRGDFAFMSNEISSERRVEASVGRIATLMRETRAAGRRIVFVAGPVVVHTGGAVYFTELIRRGWVDVLLSGTRWRSTTPSSRCSAPRSESTSKPARRSRAATAITCGPSTRSTARAASGPRWNRAC